VIWERQVGRERGNGSPSSSLTPPRGPCAMRHSHLAHTSRRRCKVKRARSVEQRAVLGERWDPSHASTHPDRTSLRQRWIQTEMFGAAPTCRWLMARRGPGRCEGPSARLDSVVRRLRHPQTAVTHKPSRKMSEQQTKILWGIGAVCAFPKCGQWLVEMPSTADPAGVSG
jgi:hypothetical protein